MSRSRRPRTTTPAAATGGATPVLPAVREPEPGVAYTQVLRGSDFTPARSFIGLALALFAYALVVPLVNQGLLAAFWVAQGRPGTFTEYFGRARGYEVVGGLVAAHVALASLIVIAWALVRHWHHRPGAYLGSVQPGLRWRYLLLCLPLAALALNGVLWATRGVGALQAPQPLWGWWLLAIVVFSPLQAAGEEFFFRGYLMQSIGALVPQRWFGVVVSAAVFAFFHGTQNVWLFLDRFAFGLLAGALVVLTGGLEAAVAAHVANNVFAFGYAVFTGGVAQTRGLQAIGPMQAVLDVVSFTLVAVLCWWLGRRLRVATTTPA